MVPFTDIHPLAGAALHELVPSAERVNVGKNPLAYSRLIAELWQEGEPFLVIEHDIEPTALALQEATECECWWSVSPFKGDGSTYEMASLLNRSLGFTRFRAELLREFPDAVMLANSINDGGSICPPGHWKRLDARLQSVLRDNHYVPHEHSIVPHHHWYHYGCACGQEHD